MFGRCKTNLGFTRVRGATVALFVLCLHQSMQAEVTIQLFGAPNNQVSEGSSVELVLSQRDQSSDLPDLSALHSDFEISPGQSSFSSTIINGSFSSESRYTVTLTPRRPGTFKIGPLTWNGQSTGTILLKVTPMDAATKQAIDSAIFFELEHSPEKIYVSGAVYLKRRLYYLESTQLINNLPALEANDNLRVLRLRDTQLSRERRNGQSYNVQSDEWILFPEKSGNMVLPSQTVRAAIRPIRGMNRRVVRVSTEPTTFDVLTIPNAFPADADWFVASDVKVDAEFDRDIADLSVGEALTYTLTVTAVDTHADTFPAIEPVFANGVKSYSETPATRSYVRNNKVNAEAVLPFTLIPTEAGHITFPEFRLPWWNALTDSLEYAIIKPQFLRVAMNESSSARFLPPVEPTPPESNHTLASDSDDLVRSSTSGNTLDSTYIRTLEVSLGGLIILFATALVLFFVRERRQRRSFESTQETADPKTTTATLNTNEKQDKNPLLWLAQQLGQDLSQVQSNLNRSPEAQALLREMSQNQFRKTQTEQSDLHANLHKVLKLLRSKQLRRQKYQPT